MHDTPPLPIDDEADDRPSKSALKREAHDLQALGVALAELPDARLAELPIDESLRDAVRMYNRTRSHEGRRRQMQFVGKLMRKADIEPLRQAVASARLGGAHDSLRLHLAERWREELVRDPEALTRWMAEHPDSDTQRLRSLIRSAQKDAAAAPEQRHGRAWRELFQFIKPHLTAAP